MPELFSNAGDCPKTKYVKATESIYCAKSKSDRNMLMPDKKSRILDSKAGFSDGKAGVSDGPAGRRPENLKA